MTFTLFISGAVGISPAPDIGEDRGMTGWEARLQKLSNSARLQTEIIGQEQAEGRDLPLYAFSAGRTELPAVVVAAGVHGDEPEAVEAALHLLEEADQGRLPVVSHRLVVFPCLNPSGLLQGTRSNAAGQDINRQFHGGLTAATAAVRRFLPGLPMAALVDLHADRTTDGFYFFEMLQQEIDTLAPSVQRVMTEAGFRLEGTPFYAGLSGDNGLIAPTGKQMEGFERAAPGASLAQWTWQIGVPRNYVFETPQAAGELACVGMLLTALRALFAALETRAG